MSPVLAPRDTSMASSGRRPKHTARDKEDWEWIYQAVGSDAPTLISRSLSALQHYYSATTHQPTESTLEKFERLREQWISETAFESSTSRMVANPAYQAIIGMSWDAVPLMLEELRQAPQHWFWALKAITEVDPVQQGTHGDIAKMSECWVRWGIGQKLIKP